MSDYRLSDLLDLTTLQKIADAHYRAAGMPIGIIDAIDGSILVGSGWQDICAKFHRANPVSLQRCRESDNYIKDRLVEGEACHYKCKNGLWDIGVPIVVVGRHLATMFLGQFFYEEEVPDREFFIQLAHEFGFDVDEYLVALDLVPVFSREKVDYILEYDKALVSFIADIAEQSLLKIKADEIIRESERKFHALFDHAHQFLGLLSIDGRVLDANMTALRFSGVEEADVIGKPFWEAHWWAHSAELREEIRLAVQKAAKGEFIRFEPTLTAADGSLHHIDFSLKPVTDDAGKVVLLIPEGRDITEHKLAEKKVLEQVDFLRTLFDTIPNPIFHKDANGRYTGCNRAFLEFTGKPMEAILGKTVYDMGSKDIADEYAEKDRELLEHPGKQRYEWQVHNKLGGVREVIFDKATLLDAHGAVSGLIGVISDITERKRAEKALRLSEARHRTLVATIPDLVWLKDMNGVYLSCNPTFERFFGAKEADIVGRTDYDFNDKDLADFFRENDRKAIEMGGPSVNEEELTFADNGYCGLFETIKTPMRDAQGHLVGVLGISRDITERKRAEEERRKLEEQLFQAQKMESVGRLAGGVAHDFNNMLGVIIGRTEMALNVVARADPLHESLQEILKAANRSADITRQLLAFARKQTVSPKILDLNDTISGMLKMLRRLIGEDIDLSWMPGDDLWKIRIDSSQIDQILANLVVNSRDAISGTGSITLKTENVVVDESCRPEAEFIAGEYVLLTMNDTGAGMDNEVLDHIFEPFFTTKEVGKGTGLGLSTIYGIVKQNDGFIYAYSEPGRGTTFKIYLPRFEEQNGQTLEETVPVRKLQGGSETILLAEDDEPLLGLAKIILQSLGYTVLAAKTPKEAIRLSESFDGDIHMLVTDVVMPEMNGRELAERLHALRPGLKCLYMSGYTADIIAHRGVLDDDVDFINKPFKKNEFARRIREILDQKLP